LPSNTQRVLQAILARGTAKRYRGVYRTFEKTREAIELSTYLTKEAMKKPETRKRWFINHIPEFFTIGYLAAYGIAEFRYYQDPVLSRLAKYGLTTQGTYGNPFGGVISLDVIKPWLAPPRNYIPTDSFGHVSSNFVRTLAWWEDDIVGGSFGLIPTIAKYVVKGFRYFRKRPAVAH